MKILVAEAISPKGIDVMLEAGFEVDVEIKLTREELLERIGQYDCIIVRSVTKVNEEFYNHATNLKVVGRGGTGVDNIEMAGATKRGIIVVNTPEANIVSAAEHTVGLMLASCRNIPVANNRLKSGVWERAGLKGVELNGKTVGIVGLGRIGSLVATRLQSFGMKVIAYDPYITDARFQKYDAVKKENLLDLMRECDLLTVHTPKTAETFGMIGEDQFKVAKKGLRVVNCARGGIINEEALIKAMEDGIVASAGIDVLVHEPCAESPFFSMDQVVLTPHLGADTFEAQDNVGVTVAHEVISALRGEMVPNAVNLPSLHHRDLEAIRPYLNLGEILGKLYHQLAKEPVETVEITYSGEVAGMETGTITLAVLKGLFETILTERVNFVNASLIAQTRGVAVTESRETAGGNYLNLIRLQINAGGEAFSVAGTVFGKGELRIVELNGFEFDVTPSPFMLVAENSDTPGMIGQIGTLLGASKINIATMQVSRNQQKGRAMMVMTVDSQIPQDFLGLIGKVTGIFSVNAVAI